MYSFVFQFVYHVFHCLRTCQFSGTYAFNIWGCTIHGHDVSFCLFADSCLTYAFYMFDEYVFLWGFDLALAGDLGRYDLNQGSFEIVGLNVCRQTTGRFIKLAGGSSQSCRV
jgi:hypothetical protein